MYKRKLLGEILYSANTIAKIERKTAHNTKANFWEEYNPKVDSKLLVEKNREVQKQTRGRNVSIDIKANYSEKYNPNICSRANYWLESNLSKPLEGNYGYIFATL